MKRLLLVLPLLLTLVAFLPSTTSAKTVHQAHPILPLTTYTNVYALLSFNAGFADGGLTTLYVPNFSATGSNYLLRMFYSDIQSGGNMRIIVGIEYNYDITTIHPTCKRSTGSFFFIQVDSTNHIQDNYCAGLNAGDAGHTVEVGFSPGANGYDDVWIHNTGSGINPCNVCVTVIKGTLKGINYNSEQFTNTFTGTLQGGWFATNNQYHSLTNHNWNYDLSSGVSIWSSSSPPPQMYWNPAPAVGNHGGSLEFCIRDTTQNSC